MQTKDEPTRAVKQIIVITDRLTSFKAFFLVILCNSMQYEHINKNKKVFSLDLCKV